MDQDQASKVWDSLELTNATFRRSSVDVFIPFLQQVTASQIQVTHTLHASYFELPREQRGPEKIGYVVTQVLNVNMHQGAVLAAHLDCVLALTYACDLPWDGEFGEQFCKSSALINSLPFFREWLLSMCSRHNLPEVILPLFKFKLAGPVEAFKAAPKKKPRKRVVQKEQ